jgi:hypothetical protein
MNSFDSNPGAGFLKQYVRGYNDYSQAGTDIPSGRIQNNYAQESGGPLQGQTLISSDPSFQIYPDIDDPIVDKWVYGRPDYKPAPPLDMEEFNRRLLKVRDEVHRTLKGV